MNVTLESSGNLLIAYLFGEIDHHTAVAVRSQIDSAIQDKLPGHLILDFKNVTFMDSSGIGLVMGRYRLVHSYQGTVEIKNVTARTKKIMELAPEGSFGMVDAFQIGFQLLPDFIPIMARMLDVDEEELRNLDGHTGMLLLSEIWNANERLFLDFFTLAATLCPKVGVKAAVPTA